MRPCTPPRLTSLEAALDGLSAAAAESGADRYVPPAEPHRISQRDSRSAGARCRRRGAAAERFRKLRIRQRDGRQFVSDLLESYVSAAEKISQLAVGRPGLSVGGTTVRIKPDITQEGHLDGLPLGTRGGALVSHTFPMNGEYEITIRLARDRNEHIEGLLEPHEVELLARRRAAARVHDRADLALAGRVRGRRAVARDAGQPHEGAAAGDRRAAHPGRHVPEEAVADPRNRAATLRGALQLLPPSASAARGLRDFDRRSVQPAGAGDTPSRRRVFTCQPASAQEEDGCAQKNSFDADAPRLSPACRPTPI